MATLGPATEDPGRLRAVLEAGVDVVRLNFSHGSREEHAATLERVRDISEHLGRVIGCLGDLQGPKIRLGRLPEEGVTLEDGHDVVLICGREELDDYDDGNGTPILPVTYREMADDLQAGALVLMTDGLIRLVVSSTTPVDSDSDGDDDGTGRVRCRVVAGGTVTSRSGINLPGVSVSARTLTDKDRQDLAAMVDMGVDWIAMSFVRRPEDVVEVRKLVASHGGSQPVVAKLERPEVVDDLGDIIETSDAVMVARGDLGVEVGPERVPALQKEIIARANSTGRPVITATEMLESMIRNPRPTRAEASDVANAIFDGTDAVMLSGETAIGRFPVESVRTMSRIIEVAEGSRQFVHPPEPPTHEMSVGRVVAKAAVATAQDVRAKALVVFSLTGASVQLVSKFRPDVPIIGLTPEVSTLRRLPLLWGSSGDLVPEKDHTRDLILAADDVCLSDGYGDKDDAVVIVSGIPGGHGGTNRILVHRLGHAPGN